MLEETSIEARTLFLLKFTQELISNSKGTEMYRLEEIIRKKVGLPSLFKEIKQIPKEKIDERVKEILYKKPAKPVEELKEPVKKIMPLPQTQQKFVSLAVPRPKFQQTSQYLAPPPAPNIMDFGKIESLTKDPNVKSIEFQNENTKIIVDGKMGRKFTGIMISQEESKNLLNDFSKNAKIPLTNGINKIALGNFLITAIISGDKINNFIIKRNENNFNNLRPPNPSY